MPRLQTIGPAWAWLRRHLYPRAAGLLTMTKGAMSQFPPNKRPRRWVIPNEASVPSGSSVRSGQKTLTAVGRLVPQKGFDLLL